jgi:hypothetical protein
VRAEEEVFGQPHGAHPTLPEALDHPVLAGKDVS